MRYSVQPRDPIFIKGYGFLSFAKNMVKIIGKNISKNQTSKYCQNFLDHAKKYTRGALKTSSKRFVQKTAKAAGDLIGNKIANKITKVPKIHNKIIQRQLQMSIINKYLKKGIYLQNKENKFLMI